MKKLICLALALTLLLGALPHAVAAEPTLANFTAVQNYGGEFADVPAGAWYEQNVALAYELGLVRGKSDTMFEPNSDIQISEALTFACRLHSIYHSGSADFVQGSPWYQVYVDYATANGIIAAGEYTDFSAKATRAQFARIFANVLPDDAMPYINDIPDGWIPDVTDDMTCRNAVYHLYRAGILTGSDDIGTFKPDTHIIRAEVAAIVTRMALEGQRKAFRPLVTLHEGFTGYVDALGLSTDKLSQSTISGVEMTELLDKLVAYAAPDKLAEWQTKYPVLRASAEPLNRYDTLAALYLALWHIGGDYGYLTPVIDHSNTEIRAMFDGEEWPTWELFGTIPDFELTGWGTDHYGIAGCIYNISRVCLVDGSYPLGYDKENNSFHLFDGATYADALLAVLRSVSIAETEYVVAVDDPAATQPSGVLTDELIAKANANPVVTSEDHPRWTGFVLGYGYIDQIGTSAGDIELSAEWGFNSARVMMNYKTLFSDDTETADLAMLTELDKLVAAAIQNDIHLNICFNALPGRISYMSEDYVVSGDFDLFINPEKQEQALRIFKTIAARYKDIPNFNLSITPLWEPLNKNLSTGQPAPEYEPEDTAAFLGRVIDVMRAEDPDRLIIYEATADPGYNTVVEESLPAKIVADERGNVIISYNACEQSYVYACMTSTEGSHIDNMNRSMDLPSYPNYIYSIISKIYGDNILTLNGLLPAGTTVDLYLEGSNAGTLDIHADGKRIYSEELPEQRYEVGERLSRHYPYAESDKCIRVTLESDVDELVISCRTGAAHLCGIYLTLPDEYARERWYYAQPYDVYLGLEEQAGVALRTSSGIMLAPNNDSENGRTVTIHDDLTYTSEHVWDEASADTVNEWAARINEFDSNCVIRFERGTFSGTTWESLKAYYEDLLESYEEYGFSWWSNDWWEVTNKTGTIAEAEYIEYAGYEHFNLELLQLLQKYRSED